MPCFNCKLFSPLADFFPIPHIVDAWRVFFETICLKLPLNGPEGFARYDVHFVEVYDAAKESGLQPKDLFQALYLILLGKNSGPKLGSLIIAFGKGKCIARIKEAAG